MVDDDFDDDWDSDECLGDESLAAEEAPQKMKKGHARRLYENLMEDRRLKQQLDDDLAFW